MNRTTEALRTRRMMENGFCSRSFLGALRVSVVNPF